MFHDLEAINARPEPFAIYNAAELWADEHTAKQMLSFHLDGTVDVSSRRHEFIERSATWIASRFKVGAHTSIVDFGCGPGLYTTRLAKTQAKVTGIDFSRSSIRHARQTAAKQGLRITYLTRDYLVWEPDQQYDLILMIMCDFCALSPAQRQALLAKFARILQPGGSLLLDVYSLRAFARRQETATYAPNLLDGFWSSNRYHGFLNTFKYEPEKVILDKYTIIEAQRRRVIYNWLQYFSPDSLREALSEAEFVVEALLSDVAGGGFAPDSDEFAVIACKRTA